MRNRGLDVTVWGIDTWGLDIMGTGQELNSRTFAADEPRY